MSFLKSINKFASDVRKRVESVTQPNDARGGDETASITDAASASTTDPHAPSKASSLLASLTGSSSSSSSSRQQKAKREFLTSSQRKDVAGQHYSQYDMSVMTQDMGYLLNLFDQYFQQQAQLLQTQNKLSSALSDFYYRYGTPPPDKASDDEQEEEEGDAKKKEEQEEGSSDDEDEQKAARRARLAQQLNTTTFDHTKLCIPPIVEASAKLHITGTDVKEDYDVEWKNHFLLWQHAAATLKLKYQKYGEATTYSNALKKRIAQLQRFRDVKVNKGQDWTEKEQNSLRGVQNRYRDLSTALTRMHHDIMLEERRLQKGDDGRLHKAVIALMKAQQRIYKVGHEAVLPFEPAIAQHEHMTFNFPVGDGKTELVHSSNKHAYLASFLPGKFQEKPQSEVEADVMDVKQELASRVLDAAVDSNNNSNSSSSSGSAPSDDMKQYMQWLSKKEEPTQADATVEEEKETIKTATTTTASAETSAIDSKTSTTTTTTAAPVQDDDHDDVERMIKEIEVQAWEKNGDVDKDLRTLLGTLHVVIYQDGPSELQWTPCATSDLDSEEKVDRQYHKAIAVLRGAELANHHSWLAGRIRESMERAHAALDESLP